MTVDFPIVTTQRFFPIHLDELLDIDSIPVMEYLSELAVPGPRELADKVIRDITYPMHLGIPDDLHIWNAFHGGYCLRRTLDFWQAAGETASARIGDCEDSSILYVAGAHHWLSETELYEVFGVVMDRYQVLGGHGWGVASFDGGFRLIESTLDTPPDEYPLIPDPQQPFWLGDLCYQPHEVWNKKRYIKLKDYLGKRDTLAKFLAIERAWQITPKPLREMRRPSNRAKRVIFLTYRKV